MVRTVIEEVKNTCYDHHLIFGKIGEKLGFVNESVVRAAFLTTWCEINAQKVKGFLNEIYKYLPKLRGN